MDETTVNRATGLLSAKQASEWLNISDRKLRSLTRSGEVACAKIGRRVLYRIRDLERFVERAVRKAG